jgi:hypothetical protein
MWCINIIDEKSRPDVFHDNRGCDYIELKATSRLCASWCQQSVIFHRFNGSRWPSWINKIKSSSWWFCVALQYLIALSIPSSSCLNAVWISLFLWILIAVNPIWPILSRNRLGHCAVSNAETTASEFLFLIVTLEQSRSFWGQISTCPSSTTGSSNGTITFYRELIDVTVLSSFHATLTK